MKTTYRAVVRAAKKNILTGGVKVHKSSPFGSKEQAQNFLDAIVDGNKKAGNKMSAAYISENRDVFA